MATLPADAGPAGEPVCAWHPTVETGLTCARCETPICGRCAVSSAVGMRCRNCLGRADIRSASFGAPT